MKNMSMKKIYSYALGALMLVGFAALVPVAHAQAATFNDNPADCPTVMVAIASTGRTNGCYPVNVNATPGSVVNAIIYYHNTSPDAATNVVVRLSPQNGGSNSAQTFSGSVSASNAATVSGQGVISISTPEPVAFGTVAWYPNQQSYTTPLPNGQTGAELFGSGLNLGTIDGYSTCPVVGGSQNIGCHQGWLYVSYLVGSGTTSSCSITGFNASPTTVTSGGSTTLNWSTSSGCTNATVTSSTGGTISNALSGNQNVGPITQTTTYTISANGSSTSATPQSVTVSVNSPSQCTINSFSGPGSVTSGNTATLNWTTQNCTSVTISGTNVSYTTSNSSQVASGSTVTGAVYGSTQYTMTATNGTNTATSYTTVTTNSVSNNCTASLTASQTQVTSGQSAYLTWTSSGCTSVVVSGPNGTLSTSLSGSQQTLPIYGSATYTLIAYGTNTVNQSVYISTYNGNQNTLTATTNSATNVTTTSANLNGYIYANGSCTYSCSNTGTYYFQYGTNQYSMYSQTPTQTFYSTTSPVTAYVGNLLPNTTYYFQLVASGTNGLVYGGTLSFVTTGGTVGGVTALTLLADNISQTSARLNGLVVTQGNTYGSTGTTYYEYGTSQALGLQTAAQTLAGASNNYYATINTSPNTTYYYRIDANVNGQLYQGSIISFTTLGNNIVTPPVVITRVIGTGGGSAYISLSITDQSQTVDPNDTIVYTVTYQNISGVTLSNAILNVILPTDVTFKQASQGLLTTNNTVAATLGTLTPQQQGTISITAQANPTIIPGNNLVTTATIAFTTPGKAQDSAIAYVLNTVGNPNNLAGLALFGAGFFPTSLLGWILLLGLLLVLILIARYFYHRANAAQRAAQAPAVHQYYAPAPMQNQPPMQNMNQAPMNNGYQQGYQGDHLPH